MMDVKLGEAIAGVSCRYPLILGRSREAGYKHEKDEGAFAGYGKPDYQILNFDLDRYYGVFGPKMQEIVLAFLSRFEGGYPRNLTFDLVEFGCVPHEENWIQQIASANLVVQISRIGEIENASSTISSRYSLPALVFSGRIQQLSIKLPDAKFRCWDGVVLQSQLAPSPELGELRPVLAVGDQIEVVYRAAVDSGNLLGSRTPDGITTHYSFIPSIIAAQGGTPSERPSILSLNNSIADEDC